MAGSWLQHFVALPGNQLIQAELMVGICKLCQT